MAESLGLDTETLSALPGSGQVLFAAACAERDLPYFESAFPNDHRPRDAIAAVRSWVICPCEKHFAAVSAFDQALRNLSEFPPHSLQRSKNRVLLAASGAALTVGFAINAVREHTPGVGRPGRVSSAARASSGSLYTSTLKEDGRPRAMRWHKELKWQRTRYLDLLEPPLSDGAVETALALWSEWDGPIIDLIDAVRALSAKDWG